VNRLLCRICDHAHWHVSEQVRTDVASYMPTRRNAVLHNTCDMESAGDRDAAEALLAPVRSGAEPFLILLPGRLLARKGHVLLLRAATPLIAREGLTPHDIRIIFAGAGPDRGAVEAAVRATGLEAHVTLLGAVPNDALLAMYGMADLVVVPSLIEGFGIVAIEALSRGALLIASDAAGLDEIVRPELNALQFPAGDETALAALLARVWACRGEGLIDRSGLHAEMAERFGIEHHLDRMLALLGEAGQ
jgi:glycosyltransferase involved in cell wall biosynthesis